MLQKPPGERVKTAKDAIHLARLLRLDQLFATTAALLMTIVLVAGLLMRQPRGLGCWPTPQSCSCKWPDGTLRWPRAD
jgi:hypothetical protein